MTQTVCMLGQAPSDTVAPQLVTPLPSSQQTPLQMHAGITGSSRAQLHVIPASEGASIVRVTLPNRRQKYSAGQWVFLCFPRAGLLSWHPYTVSSGADDKELTLHVACEDGWSRRIAALARESAQAKVQPPLPLIA
jgi:FAD-binding domain